MQRQGIEVPGPNMPPRPTQTVAAPVAVLPEVEAPPTVDTFSFPITSQGSPLMPNGGVPIIGVPSSKDYPRLAFTAPYFGSIAFADAISTTADQTVQLVTSSSSIGVSSLATYVSMRQAAAAAVTITLPPNPSPGRSVTIKDSLGVCSADNFTINTTDGTLIDGQPTYVFMVGFQSQLFVFDGVGWGING